MKETLYIYTRVSTSMQKEDGTGLAEQKRLGVERAKQLNMEPLILDEGSMSGSGEDIEQRPVLSNLIALIRKGEVKNLYVYNGDRLARHSLTSAIINHDIVENGVTVHTHFGTYTDTPQDQLMMDLVGVFAKYENKVRTARLKSGRFAKAKEGKWMLGKPLFGYGLDKEGRLKVDKVQGDYVKQMFEWFDSGIGITEIAKMLDGKIKTPGNKVLWSGQSVRNILTHTHYKGFYTYLGLTINCQTIVSPQIWESVNKNLANRKTRSKSVGVKKYDYLLRPIMSCGDCGSVYHGESKKRRGEYRYSYVCSSRDKSYKKKIAKGDWKRGKYCKNTVSIEAPEMGIYQKSCPFHTLVQLDSTEQFQINSSCYPLYKSKQVSWFTLPPLQEWYYKYRHPDYQVLPRFKEGCNEEKSKIMDFIYPKGNTSILVPKDLNGVKGSAVFHVVHKDEKAILYWFLNETFLGKTKSTHKIEVNPKKMGERRIIVIDDKGNKLEKRVQFIEE